MDDDFQRQLTARLQAHEFLLLAVIRGHLHQMEPAEAAETIATLKQQFSTLHAPADARPDADLDELMAMHRDAQFFLDRLLKQASPQSPGAGER